MDSSSIPLSAESYEAAVDLLLSALEASFGSLERNEWHICAVTAQEHLLPSSAVRRRKGYTNLYLADSDLTGHPLTIHDAAASPRSGVEVLYGIVSGPGTAAARIARLGLWSEASVLILSRDPETPETLKSGIAAALRTTPSDTVKWDLETMFSATPSVIGVAGLMTAPIGVMRIRVCVTENFKRDLVMRLSSAKDDSVDPRGASQ